MQINQIEWQRLAVVEKQFKAITDAASQPTKWCYNVQHNEFNNRQIGWKGVCQSYYYQKHDLGRSRDEIVGGLCDIREVVVVPTDVLAQEDNDVH